MGICPTELLTYVVRPTLEYLSDYSKSAETLLMGTAAVESNLGFHIKQQIGVGLGVYQIKPQRHQDIWDNFLAKDPDMASKVRGLASQHEFLINPHLELTTNLRYSTAIAWMIYKSTDKALPEAENIEALGQLWHSCFHSNELLKHTNASASTFVERYNTLIKPTHAAA